MTTITDRVVKNHKPGVVFQPDTHRALLKGIDTVVDAVKPTLGPVPRFVASEEPERNKRPELLDSGALIARRIIELTDQSEDMGAMLVRQMLWRIFERSGDGTASAAVIFQSLMHEGLRYVAAGVDPQRLREKLLRASKALLNHIDTQSLLIEDRSRLEQFIFAVIGDPHLAQILSEVFDVLGPFAEIHIRQSHGNSHNHEYVAGVLWNCGVCASNMLLNRGRQRTDFDFAAVLMTDFDFDDPNDLVPIIQLAATRYQALVLVASHMSERCVDLINHVNTQPNPFQMIAVKLPAEKIDQHHLFEELEASVGGVALRTVFGDTIENISEAHFGRAERIWANTNYFCVEVPVEEQLDARTQLIQRLHTSYEDAAPENRDAVRRRLGRLMGAGAIIYLGGWTESQFRDYKDTVKRHITVIRGAMESGVVTGGGAAYIRAAQALDERNSSDRLCAESAAQGMLRTALSALTNTLIANAGYDSGPILSRLNSESFELINGHPILTEDPTVYDSAAVVKDALDSAVRTASLALTIDVLVQHRKPEFSAVP